MIWGGEGHVDTVGTPDHIPRSTACDSQPTMTRSCTRRSRRCCSVDRRTHATDHSACAPPNLFPRLPWAFTKAVDRVRLTYDSKAYCAKISNKLLSPKIHISNFSRGVVERNHNSTQQQGPELAELCELIPVLSSRERRHGAHRRRRTRGNHGFGDAYSAPHAELYQKG